MRPDRRGLANGARWEVVGPSRPTLFRKAYSTGMLLVREVEPYLRECRYLTVERLRVEVELAALGPERTLVRVSVEGPWRPEAFGRPRALPKAALTRLHALCQTTAQL